MRLLPATLLLGMSCAPAALPPGALVAGCAMITPDGACWSEAGTLTVWSPGPALRVDGAPAAGVPVDGGTRYDVTATNGATLTLDGAPLVTVLREVDGVGACPATSPIGAAWCERVAGREAMSTDSTADAAARFDRAAIGFFASGWTREGEINRDRAAWLRAKAGGPVATPDPAPTWDAHRWLMTARVAEVGLRAAGRLHELERLQRRILSVEARTDTAQAVEEATLRQARTALMLGDVDEALPSLLATLHTATGDGCDALDTTSEIAWELAQLWLARAPVDLSSPLALAESRFSASRIEACSGMDRAGDRWVDLALLQLIRGDFAAAEASLTSANAHNQRAETRMWAAFVRAEVALATGRPALADATAVADAAAEAGLVEGRWLARDLAARARLAAGDLSGALADFEDAAAELSRTAALTPLLGGRAAFLDQRADATARHVEALVAAGRTADAIEVARQWRRAAAAGAWAAEQVEAMDTGARAVWEGQTGELREIRAAASRLERRLKLAPATEIAKLQEDLRAAEQREQELVDSATSALGDPGKGHSRAPGEALLVVAPAGDRWHPGWRSLWRDDLGAVAGPLAPALVPDPATLLPVAAPRLTAPAVVSLMLPASLDPLPLHLVTVDGRPWALTTPVRWSLDLPEAPAPATPRTAVLVGDPEGALAGARAERDAAGDVLRAAGWAVTDLGRGTDRAALVDALRGQPTTWLQVAAHGASRGGNPRLLLADGTAWTARDALTMDAAPVFALLSGCNTAASAPGTTSALGLGHAFVRGGTTAAFATTVEIDDAVAAHTASALLAAAPWEVGAERALQAALRAADHSGELAQVAGYRVITR